MNLKKLLTSLFILILLVIITILSTLLFLSQQDNKDLESENDDLSALIEDSEPEDDSQEPDSTEVSTSNLEINVPGLEAEASFKSNWKFSHKVQTATEEGIGTYPIDETIVIKLNDEKSEILNDDSVQFSGFSFELKNGSNKLDGVLNTVPNQIFLALNESDDSIVKVKDQLYRKEKDGKWNYVTSLGNCPEDTKPCYSDNFAYVSEGGIALSLNYSGADNLIEEVDAFVVDLLGY